ncbi:MAG: hypothetical protein KKD55_05070, partial [Candidatus Omnitrophica bacterium]|nr:hypothetical protein [Candidatus Omnitrophota bacterium]
MKSGQRPEENISRYFEKRISRRRFLGLCAKAISAGLLFWLLPVNPVPRTKTRGFTGGGVKFSPREDISDKTPPSKVLGG